jgi:hypothetical protein
MAAQGQPGPVRTLAAMWRQWCHIVHLYATRQKGRERLDPKAYHALHAKMLASVRELKAGGEPGAEEFFGRLEELLAPWVTLGSLHFADHEVVYRLMIQGQRMQEPLDEACGIRWRRRALKFTLVGGGALTGVLAGYILWQRFEVVPMIARGARAVELIWWRLAPSLMPSSTEGRFVLFGGIGTLGLVFLLWVTGKMR